MIKLVNEQFDCYFMWHLRGLRDSFIFSAIISFDDGVKVKNLVHITRCGEHVLQFHLSAGILENDGELLSLAVYIISLLG